MYEFKSKLKYVILVDLRDGKAPVGVEYKGKNWGGKMGHCWDYGEGRAFEFEFHC